MSVENPSVLYVEQTLTAEQKERVCLNIGAQLAVPGKGLSSNDYTDAEKTKLSSIESGAQTNVKPDWNAVSGTAAEILNKPTIPTVDQSYDGMSANAQSGTAVASAISELSFDEVPTVTSSDDGKVLKATYSGGTGSYSWDTDSGDANVIEAITVNGETTTISGKTVNIPAAIASIGGVGGMSGVITPNDKEKLDGLVSNVQSDWNAASGSASEILNKPTIPSVDQTYDGASANAQSGMAVASAISGINVVPTVGSSDNGKVLKASYSAGASSYSWQTESGGGASYTPGNGIDISSNDEISVKTDGTTIHANASGELEVIGGGGGGEVNVIEGVKLAGATSVLTPDTTKNVTIPNAVATGESGATNGLMTADDKKSLGTAVQYKVNPLESGTPALLAQQLYVVESDAQIISIAGQSSEIQGKGTIFFRVGV